MRKTSLIILLAFLLLNGGAWFVFRSREVVIVPLPVPQTEPLPAKEIAPMGDDAQLVHSLLLEKLSGRTFSFATVVEACSGKKVLPFAESPAHERVRAALGNALSASLGELSQENSPVRTARRINEVSRFFEDSLREKLNATPGLTCTVPLTRRGTFQRSGYPDLKITDQETGCVFYLDPKLVEEGSEASTFRSFYFEPKESTLKVTDDAVHLLVGIFHDGNTRRWKFTSWQLVDLSALRVHLKAEFQASNKDMYPRNSED